MSSLQPLTPKKIYTIAKVQMKDHLSDYNQQYNPEADQKRGFDKNHRERLRSVLCLSEHNRFDEAALNVCKTMRKDAIFNLINVSFIPVNKGNVDYDTGETLAKRVMKVLEDEGYEFY